jgi:hypothetical protein
MEPGKPPGAAGPISFEDVLEARLRIRPHLQPTPLRRYAALDAAAGKGIAVWVKHENHNPTNSFKAQRPSMMTAPGGQKAGVVAATRQSRPRSRLGWIALGVAVTIPCRAATTRRRTKGARLEPRSSKTGRTTTSRWGRQALCPSGALRWCIRPMILAVIASATTS